MSSSARCVVWHAPNAPLPAELTSALDRRGLAWKSHASDFSALAALCRARPDDTTPTILLLVEPRTLTTLPEMLDAADRYRPATALWVYDSKEQQRLAAYSRRDIAAKFARPAPASVAAPPRAAPATGPVLRLAGEGPNLNTPSEQGPKTAFPAQFAEPSRIGSPPASHLLTDEELTMLLSGDEGSGKG